MDSIIKDERRELIEKMHRENILNAAEELFSTKGYEKTTVDDIAHKSQYSKRTIYIYFKSKVFKKLTSVSSATHSPSNGYRLPQ
ncbi:MAG: helix-turn-helix domain-containing protein [Oscillospiraceae bacterium]